MNPLENIFVTQSYLGDQRNGKSNFCTWNVVMKVPNHDLEQENDDSSDQKEEQKRGEMLDDDTFGLSSKYCHQGQSFNIRITFA
jgi:hypothetical protein